MTTVRVGYEAEIRTHYHRPKTGGGNSSVCYSGIAEWKDAHPANLDLNSQIIGELGRESAKRTQTLTEGSLGDVKREEARVGGVSEGTTW
jgi:hypothetical protein